MTTIRIAPLFRGLFAALCFLAACPVWAQSAAFPAKPVRLVVGFPPGGANDILARLFAAKLQEAWGQPFVVENRPGANSIIAVEYVAKSAPDGYTLLANATGGMTVNPVLYSKLPYDTQRDFAPISMLASIPMVLVSNPVVPVHNVRELVAYANANPGKLNYSSGSSSFQVAAEMFNVMAGTNLIHVPFKGSVQSANAVLSGTTQLSLIDLPAVAAQIRAGKLRVMGLTTAKRLNTFPDLPTLDESGLTGYEMVLWNGLFAPAGTPADLVAKLSAEAQRVARLPDINEKLVALGMEAVGTTPEALAALIKRELVLYGRVVKSRGIKAEQ